MLGSKTVISKSVSKITFPNGGFLDTLSTKVPEHKFQRKMNPETKNKQSSSSVRLTDPIRLGHPPSWTSPVRRMFEPDRPRDQLGHPPSWINQATSWAIRRTGLVQFRGRPSWNDRVVLIPFAKLLPWNFIKLSLVSLRSEAPLKL